MVNEIQDRLMIREQRFGEVRHPEGHHVTNVVVTLRQDRARAHSKLVVVLDDGTAATGDYRDELVRTSAGWRIQHRVGVARPLRSRRGRSES